MRTRGVKFTVAAVLFFMLTLAAVAFMPSQAHAQDAETQVSTAEISYYGREALMSLERADVLLYAYDAICEGIEESKRVIYVSDGTSTITVDEADMAFEAYRRDHTEHFWLGTSYSIYYATESEARYIIPTYTFEGAELEAAKTVFEQTVTELISDLDPELSDFEKELIIHDRLAERVKYTEGVNAHNAYGAIVDGLAVCEGYAEAFQYLMQRVGVQGFIATGSSKNPTTSEAVGHAWNIFRIDGKYYHTDLTWNDQGSTIYHAYFNLSEASILEDHTLDATAYPLPLSDSEEMAYFSVKPGKLEGREFSVDQVAELISAENKPTHFYITGSTDAFISWFGLNARAIASELGVSGKFSYSYARLGREIVVSIMTCTHTNLETVNETEASCTDGGNILYYRCECGKYFSDRFARNEITDRQSVLTDKKGHDFTLAIQTEFYIKDAGTCRDRATYWHACSRCNESAENDPFAYSKFYTGATYGSHNPDTEWTSEDTEHYKKCLIAGCDEVFDRESCHGGTASCISLAVCDVCGNAYGVFTEHSPSLDEWGYISSDGHARVCAVDGCGHIEDVSAHSGAVCSECGYENPSAGDGKDGGLGSFGEALERIGYIAVIAGAIVLALIIAVMLLRLRKRRGKDD